MAVTPDPGRRPRVGIVVITRDRREQLARTLDHLTQLPGSPPIVVVDNGSSDGSGDLLRRTRPEVQVIELEENLGAAARTVGVRAAATRYVAFADDDSWWAAGALDRAASVLDGHPRVGAIAARVLVGDGRRLDPTCAEMARSPLVSLDHDPGRRVLGFLACGSIVRAAAYLEVGGFPERYGVGGEEAPLAIDLAVAGWSIAYLDEVVAIHDPVAPADPAGRRRTEERNRLRLVWERRRLPTALRATAAAVRRSRHDPAVRGAVRDLAASFGSTLRQRRPVDEALERDLRSLEQIG